MRSVAILQASNRRKVLKLLLDSRRDEKIDAFAFTHLAENIKGNDCDGVPLERLPSELIVPTAQMRTDLDEFSRIERDVLIYHGYTLMKNRVENCCKDLLKAAAEREVGTNEGWPPPFVELVDPLKSNSECARKSRKRLESFLGWGRSRFFRDVRRFPWLFGPILAIFAVLGRGLSHILLSTQFPPIGGTVKDWVENRIMDVIVCLIPAFDTPLINLASLEKAFSATDGDFVGAVELCATIACVSISFYVALFVYWILKRLLRLPEWGEKLMLENLMAIKNNRSRS